MDAKTARENTPSGYCLWLCWPSQDFLVVPLRTKRRWLAKLSAWHVFWASKAIDVWLLKDGKAV